MPVLLSREVVSDFMHPLRDVEPPPILTFRGRDPQQVSARISLFFEGVKNLKSHLAANAGFTPNARQARQIAACLREGRELFTVARTSDFMVRPIVLFYGMVCYAKALVLSFGNPKTLEELRPGHGLTAPNQFDLPLESLQVQTHGSNRIFERFNEIYSNVLFPAQIRTNGGHSKPWLKMEVPTAESLQVSLKQALSRIVGLEDFYSLTFSEPARIARVDQGLRISNPLTWKKPQMVLILTKPQVATSVGFIQDLHPKLRLWRVREDNAHSVLFENLPADADPRPTTQDEQEAVLLTTEACMIPLWFDQAQGESFLIGTIDDIWIGQVPLLYMTGFLLSSVARYRPDLWADLASVSPSAEHVRLRAIVESFLELTLERFPLLVLQSLSRTRLDVWTGESARWG